MREILRMSVPEDPNSAEQIETTFWLSNKSLKPYAFGSRYNIILHCNDRLSLYRTVRYFPAYTDCEPKKWTLYRNIIISSSHCRIVNAMRIGICWRKGCKRSKLRRLYDEDWYDTDCIGYRTTKFTVVMNSSHSEPTISSDPIIGKLSSISAIPAILEIIFGPEGLSSLSVLSWLFWPLKRRSQPKLPLRRP